MILRNHGIEEVLLSFPDIPEMMLNALRSPIYPLRIRRENDSDSEAFDDDDPDAKDGGVFDNELEEINDKVPTISAPDITATITVQSNSSAEEDEIDSETDNISLAKEFPWDTTDKAPETNLEADSGDELPAQTFPELDSQPIELLLTDLEVYDDIHLSAELKPPNEENVEEVVVAPVVEAPKVYCTCQMVDDGSLMIECQNRSSCKHPSSEGWYHRACLSPSEQEALTVKGLKRAWYCSTCCAADFMPRKRRDLLNKNSSPPNGKPVTVVIKGINPKRKLQRMNAVREP